MRKSPCIVGVAGPSCSGKSSLANALTTRLGAWDCEVLGLDSYYRDQRGVGNYDIDVDVPQAIDHELLILQLCALANGESVETPVYDYKTHSRAGRTVTVNPTDVIVVEGIFALYWERLRQCLTASVFVDADDGVCLQRRIERDTRERGRTRQEVEYQYRHKVRPMYERFVAPTRRFATLVVDGVAPLNLVAGEVAEAIVRWAGATRE